MNKKNILILLLVLFLASQAFAESDLSRLVKKIQPAVATVITYDINRRVLGMGTGFFIDRQGHLITNYHVLRGAYTAEVKAHNTITYPVQLVVAENKTMDLVKVLVGIPETSFKWIKVSGKLPSVAERLVVIGSPMGLEQTVSEGIVSAVRRLPEIGRFFQISAPISPGSSGSPVVSMRGEVIGVATFQFVEGQNLNFAVSGEYISALGQLKKPELVSVWSLGKQEESEKEEKLLETDSFGYEPEQETTVTKYVIHFKNGKHLETDKIWEEYNQIKCHRYGTVVGYAKDDIERIEKKKQRKERNNITVDYYKPKTSRNSVKSKSRFFKIWYDTRKWKRHYPRKKGAAEFNFEHSSGGAYAVVIPGPEEMAMPVFLKRVMANTKKSDPYVKITYKDKRIVNGTGVTCLRIQGAFKDVPVIQYGYYWTGRSGNLQIVTYTENEFFQEYEKDLTDLLNGLVITRR